MGLLGELEKSFGGSWSVILFDEENVPWGRRPLKR